MENKKREQSKPFLSKKKMIWIGGGLTSVIIASALIMNLTNNETAPKERVKGVSQEQKESLTVEEAEQNQDKNQQEAVKEPQEVAVKGTEKAARSEEHTSELQSHA